MIQRDRRKRSYTSQNAKKTPLRDNGTLLSQIPLLSQVLCDKRGILKFRRFQKSTVRYQQVELFLPVDWPLTALGCSMMTHHCLRLRNLRAHYSIGLFQPACHYRICPRFLRPYTMISAVLPPLGFLETTICLSIRSFNSATWEMIPTRRLPSVRLARVL